MSQLRTGILFLWCLVCLFVLGFIHITLAASTPCSGKLINPVTDICWDCLLPISIGNTTIKSGTNPDTDNPSSFYCKCPPGDLFAAPGITLGYWEPMALVDVTRTPFCMVSLGGISIESQLNAGDITTATTRENSSFFYVHEYNFPIMEWLGVVSDHCHAQGTIIPQYFSELDPAWNDDALAMTLFPETSAFGDSVSQSACALDAASSSTGLAQDNLFWCLGAQGTTYPVTGHIAEHIGGVQASVLLTERLMFKLHRLGIVQDSNNSPTGLCAESPMPMMPKSRYRYQMTYPMATTQNLGCQPFGRSTIPWEAIYSGYQETPMSTENYNYLIWKKRNCCNSI